MRIIVTGGGGYIGSHTLVELLSTGHEVLVIDNFINSSPISLDRVRKITNQFFQVDEVDITNELDVLSIFKSFKPDAVIHLAGLKAVGVSYKNPMLYYYNNILGTISILKAMAKFDCNQIIFSSSAVVYGTPLYLPCDEVHPTSPLSPYGRTKYFIEEIIRDWTNSFNKRSSIILRYFNPMGAHSSGLIGEDPNGDPNNLLPYITNVATGRYNRLMIFGNDYNTPDGTAIRDFIHVTDLAKGHNAALKYVTAHFGCEVFNLGRGKSNSVLEVVNTFIKETGIEIPYEITSRRLGDLSTSYADIKKSKEILGWQSELELSDMIRDSWRWQSNNPDGFSD